MKWADHRWPEEAGGWRHPGTLRCSHISHQHRAPQIPLQDLQSFIRVPPAPNMHLRQQYQMLNSKRITIKFWIKVWRVWPCEGLRTECHYVRWDYVFILLCLFIISWGGRRADKGDLSRSRSQAGEGVPETLLEMCGDQTCEPCLTMFDDVVVKGGHRQAFLCLVETQETRRCSALAGHLD